MMNKSNNIFRYVYIFLVTIVALSLVLIVPIIPGVRIHDILAVSVSMKRIIFIIVASLIGVALLFVSQKSENNDNKTGKKRRESGIELLRIICMFMIILHHNKIINKIASYTFGILLIHDHHFFRNFVWTTYIKNGLWYQSNHLILRIVISGVLIFFLCSVVDYYRQNLLEKNIVRTKIFGKISNKLDRMCEFEK